MKMIAAATRPHEIDETPEALAGIAPLGMMVAEILGFGAQSGHTEIYRGAEYAVNFVPKLRIDVVGGDEMAEETTGSIRSTARTGQIGDGKILVLRVEDVVHVRSGDCGEDAL